MLAHKECLCIHTQLAKRVEEDADEVEGLRARLGAREREIEEAWGEVQRLEREREEERVERGRKHGGGGDEVDEDEVAAAAGLRAKVAGLKARMAELEEALLEQRQQQVTAGESERTQQHIASLQLEQSDAEVQRLTAVNAQSQARVARMEMARAVSDEAEQLASSKLVKKLASKDGEVQRLTAVNEELQASIQAAVAEAERMRETEERISAKAVNMVAGLKRQLFRQQQRLEEGEEEARTLHNAIEELRGELRSRDEDSTALEQTLAEKATANMSLQEEIGQLRGEVDNRSSRLTELEEECQLLRFHLAGQTVTEEAVSEMQCRLASAQMRLNELEEALAFCREEAMLTELPEGLLKRLRAVGAETAAGFVQGMASVVSDARVDVASEHASRQQQQHWNEGTNATLARLCAAGMRAVIEMDSVVQAERRGHNEALTATQGAFKAEAETQRRGWETDKLLEIVGAREEGIAAARGVWEAHVRETVETLTHQKATELLQVQSDTALLERLLSEGVIREELAVWEREKDAQLEAARAEGVTRGAEISEERVREAKEEWRAACKALEEECLRHAEERSIWEAATMERVQAAKREAMEQAERRVTELLVSCEHSDERARTEAASAAETRAELKRKSAECERLQQSTATATYVASIERELARAKLAAEELEERRSREVEGEMRRVNGEWERKWREREAEWEDKLKRKQCEVTLSDV
eukprot:jgi/Chlat1/9021/Chrsp94S08296